jgi:hypothetical protein
VGGGVATAALLLSGDDSEPAPPARSSIASSPAEDEADEASDSGEEGPPTSPSGFPAASREEVAAEVEDLLLAYHEDVVGHRFRHAWSLLSARKRAKNLREDGYPAWKRAQASLSPYLSPGGISVQVVELEDDGVARVLVKGMEWSAPGAACAEWSGLTWVKYEDDRWAYDPGYSTTPERDRAWKPRYTELLGANC